MSGYGGLGVLGGCERSGEHWGSRTGDISPEGKSVMPTSVYSFQCGLLKDTVPQRAEHCSKSQKMTVLSSDLQLLEPGQV